METRPFTGAVSSSYGRGYKKDSNQTRRPPWLEMITSR
jgi:hypothetical protein